MVFKTRCPYYKILIIEKKDNGIFLDHYSEDGESAGDSWHQTIEEAKEQAKYEFGESLSKWKLIPKDVEDSIAYVLEKQF